MASVRFTATFGAQGTSLILAGQTGVRVSIRGLVLGASVTGSVGIAETGGGATICACNVGKDGAPEVWPICPPGEEWWRTAEALGVNVVNNIAGAVTISGLLVYDLVAAVSAANTANA